jgi:hypothetical protein
MGEASFEQSALSAVQSPLDETKGVSELDNDWHDREVAPPIVSALGFGVVGKTSFGKRASIAARFGSSHGGRTSGSWKGRTCKSRLILLGLNFQWSLV